MGGMYLICAAMAINDIHRKIERHKHVCRDFVVHSTHASRPCACMYVCMHVLSLHLIRVHDDDSKESHSEGLPQARVAIEMRHLSK